MLRDWLQRWQLAMLLGRAPDPRTTRGVVLYGVLGIGIGMFLGRFM